MRPGRSVKGWCQRKAPWPHYSLDGSPLRDTSEIVVHQQRNSAPAGRTSSGVAAVACCTSGPKVGYSVLSRSVGFIVKVKVARTPFQPWRFVSGASRLAQLAMASRRQETAGLASFRLSGRWNRRRATGRLKPFQGGAYRGQTDGAPF